MDSINGKARIDYTRDTLFGPLARHVECQVSLQHKPGWLVLKVFQPLPDAIPDLNSADRQAELCPCRLRDQ